MTPERMNSHSQIADAVAAAARDLPAGDLRAHAFAEDREDVRLSLSSTGFRDIAVTRSSGGTIAGTRSHHSTHPSFLPDAFPATSAAPDRQWVVDLERAIIEAASIASQARFQPRWNARLVAFHQDIWVAKPFENCVSDTRTGRRLELFAKVGPESTGHATRDVVFHPNEQPDLRKAFELAFDRADARRVGVQTLTPRATAAIFAPGAGGVVAHELFGHALEGDVVASKRTWLQPAMSVMATAPIAVSDDPRRGRGAWRVDDEGTPSQTVRLIDTNRVTGALLDRRSGARIGHASTGHGRRSSYLDPIRPRMGCTFIEPGSDDPLDILRSTRSGVFISRLTAGQTDPSTGRAGFVVTDADLIVDGKLGAPAEPFVLELNGLESARSIDRIAGDLEFDACIGSCLRDGQPLAVSVGAPTIRIGVVLVHV